MKQELYAYIRETTRLGDEIGVVERLKASKSISAETRADYDQIGARCIDLESDQLGPLMKGVSAMSWHKMRAALLYGSSRQYKDHRQACDKAQRSGDMDAARDHAIMARRAVLAFETISEASRPDVAKKRASKRGSIPRSDHWQAQVYAAATPVQRLSVALMWATGCRPVEIEKGVSVKILTKEEDGREYILVTIAGAKITERSGQETRYLVIDPKCPAGIALVNEMRGEREIVITRPAERLNKDFKRIREKTGFKVSPYSLRHQFAANLKAEWGADAADGIAVAMGHAVTRSQGRYGSVRQAQKSGSGVIDVKATREIKETRSLSFKPRPDAAGPSLG